MLVLLIFVDIRIQPCLSSSDLFNFSMLGLVFLLSYEFFIGTCRDQLKRVVRHSRLETAAIQFLIDFKQ